MLIYEVREEEISSNMIKTILSGKKERKNDVSKRHCEKFQRFEKFVGGEV